MSILVKERGWAGHFICGTRCRYHRNTLLADSRYAIVVSTVGQFYMKADDDRPSDLGVDRYYETMAFFAQTDDPYFDANVARELRFDSEWRISEEGLSDPLVDSRADDMHDAVVQEFYNRMMAGEEIISG